MIISERIKVWKKISQTLAQKISLSQIPSFKVNLFKNKPEFAQDIQSIINIINNYLLILTDKKLDFSALWLAPSIGASRFSNSVKNIYSVSKLIYERITPNREAYSIDELKELINLIKNDVNIKSFPEPKASSFKSDISTICQQILNKLGSS